MNKSQTLRTTGLLLVCLVVAAAGACGGGSSDADETSQPDAVGADNTADVGAEEITAPEDICEPDCGEKTCGDDGCGGSCGNCFSFEGAVDNTLCLEDGSCEAPLPACSCVGKTCGEDDCGNVCGNCGDGFFCNDGFACEEEPFSCTYEEFDSVLSKGNLNIESEGTYFYFHTATGNNFPFDAIVMELDTRPPFVASAEPGLYDLPFTTFNEGGLWLYIVDDYTTDGPGKLFVPVEGALKIHKLSKEEALFKGILKAVIFQEATVDNGNVKLVEHGQTWCLDGYILEAELVVTEFGDYDPDKCVTLGSGIDIGDNIADFKIQSCSGQWISLHDGCGKSKAMWLVATAGW